jgi:hypothetical protein
MSRAGHVRERILEGRHARALREHPRLEDLDDGGFLLGPDPGARESDVWG